MDAAQSRIGSARSSSATVEARAISYCAGHSVQMPHGLPGTFAMSCVTWW